MIKAQKASDPDGSSSRLIKDCADQLCGFAMHIFNISHSLGRVLVLWKTSFVAPVPHTAETDMKFKHFRPVALTSQLRKSTDCCLATPLGIGIHDAVKITLSTGVTSTTKGQHHITQDLLRALCWHQLSSLHWSAEGGAALIGTGKD